MEKNYDDIIHLPHHQSSARPHMSLHDRAAQFAPFAALPGYGDLVRETARLTDTKVELSEDEKEKLDRSLAAVAGSLKQGIRPEAALTCFVPDERKEGGRYEVYTGSVKRIDTVRRVLILQEEDPENGVREIGFDQIISISQPDQASSDMES